MKPVYMFEHYVTLGSLCFFFQNSTVSVTQRFISDPHTISQFRRATQNGYSACFFILRN